MGEIGGVGPVPEETALLYGDHGRKGVLIFGKGAIAVLR